MPDQSNQEEDSPASRLSSITVRFGLLAAALIIWFALFGAIVWERLDTVWASVETIAGQVEPRSVAAYEMEINAIGTSLAVVKYLRSPDPEHMIRFEEDTADFWAFHQQYETLAETEEERGLADTMAGRFRDLQGLGQQIFINKDELVAEFLWLERVMAEIEGLVEAMPAHGVEAGTSLAGPAAMREVGVAMEGIEDTLAVAGWSSSMNSAAQIERMADSVRAALSKLTGHMATGQEAAPAPETALARRLTESFTAFEDSLARFQDKADLLERNFARLVELRGALDDLLDNRIQRLTTADVTRAHHDIGRQLGAASTDLAALWGGGLAILALTMILLSSTVVLPIRRLAATAAAYGRGALDRRMGSSRRDEIGGLTRALDEMARNLLDAQRVLERANSKLERTVAERTRALVNANRGLEQELEARKIMMRQLRETTALAEAANRSKTAFLANMSHELRTPLNGILGLAEMIKLKVHGPLGNERYEEYLHDILDSGQQLLRHVNDVLEISNIELGQPEVAVADIDVGSAVVDSVAAAAAAADRKGISVETDLPEGLPRILADRGRVEQVLGNLLENAVKFSPEGSRVTVSAREDGDEHVAVSVADNGSGMSDGEVETAMTLFGTEEPTCADSNRGLGLGLPLSKRLIEMQGGTLTIETEPGEGTTVRLRLPCGSDALAVPESVSRPKDPAALPQATA